MDSNLLVKQREIAFCTLHPDPHQTESAAGSLRGLQGVLDTQPLGNGLLRVTYDISLVTLELISKLLEKEGYHLDNSLLTRLKNALYFYTEETERANLGIAEENATVKLFIDHYHRRRHGCRDERPKHWRHYR